VRSPNSGTPIVLYFPRNAKHLRSIHRPPAPRLVNAPAGPTVFASVAAVQKEYIYAAIGRLWHGGCIRPRKYSLFRRMMLEWRRV